jgi:hypothetical protein
MPTTEQRGPVGAPPSTTRGTPYLPTPYVYTTVINGQSVPVTETFTPTRHSTVSMTYPTTGTILNYDEYTSRFGLPVGGAASLGYSMGLTLLAFGVALYVVIPFV